MTVFTYVPFLYMSYPVTPTLSVDALHVRVAVVPDSDADSPVGVPGACVSMYMLATLLSLDKCPVTSCAFTV